MKVALYFKNFRLGELTKEDGIFVYNSNVEGEEEAKHFPSMGLYTLYNSKKKKSKTLFQDFCETISNIKKRQDILTEIGYQNGDDEFIILCKYGKLPQNDFKFHMVTEA